MVEVVEVSSTNFTVEWAPPPDHTHNGIIREYRLNITELETRRNVNYLIQETSQLYFVVSHLHPFYTYTFTLQAVTVITGPPTEDFRVITLEAGECGA